MVISINPGSEPVINATEKNSRENINAFITDLLLSRGVTTQDVRRREDLDYGEGRYAFNIDVSFKGIKRTLEVQMPGLPLEKVRYLGKPQDIWQFPRLYIDGSSWVWEFALKVSVPEDKP